MQGNAEGGKDVADEAAGPGQAERHVEEKKAPDTDAGGERERLGARFAAFETGESESKQNEGGQKTDRHCRRQNAEKPREVDRTASENHAPRQWSAIGTAGRGKLHRRPLVIERRGSRFGPKQF